MFCCLYLIKIKIYQARIYGDCESFLSKACFNNNVCMVHVAKTPIFPIKKALFKYQDRANKRSTLLLLFCL